MPSEESSIAALQFDLGAMKYDIAALEYDLGALKYDLEGLGESDYHAQNRITRLEKALALLAADPGSPFASAAACTEVLRGPI